MFKSRVCFRVFSLKHSSTSLSNVGIYSVGTESVYQIGQSGKTECFVNVSQEDLTHELLAKHSYLLLSWLFTFQSCGGHMHHFAGCLVASYPQKLFSLQLAWVFTFSLSLTQPLQLNPTLNTGYKRLNIITIKFGTELKPTKHIVVNYNFTISPFGYSMTKPLKQTLDLNMSLGIVAKLTHT